MEGRALAVRILCLPAHIRKYLGAPTDAGIAATIGRLGRVPVPVRELMILIGSQSCRKLVRVSIDTSSNAPTARSRLYTFGPEAQSSLLQQRVSTVACSFSSCRTNRGGSRHCNRQTAPLKLRSFSHLLPSADLQPPRFRKIHSFSEADFCEYAQRSREPLGCPACKPSLMSR